jgi:DNA end-binding protein Ku
MRSIWKGAVTFGLVNVPVRLYGATEEHDLGLHQVHDKDGGRIRYQRKCEKCGETVDFAHIDKAFEDGGRMVLLSKDDLESLPVERSREIEVLEFVPSSSIDPIRLDRSYYLEPDSTFPKAYVLLREALAHTERTAVVRFSLRQKSRLGALRVYDKVLLLQTLLWDDEVRTVDFDVPDGDVRISRQELAMSAQLVESLSGEFDASQYTDDYQAQLRSLIEAKIERGDDVDTAELFADTAAPDTGGEVIDLMEALRRSVERAGGKARPAKRVAAKRTSTKAATSKAPEAATEKPKRTTSKATAAKAPATKARSTRQPTRKAG